MSNVIGFLGIFGKTQQALGALTHCQLTKGTKGTGQELGSDGDDY